MNWLRASCVLLVGSLMVAAWSCGSTSKESGFDGPDGSKGTSSGQVGPDGAIIPGDDGSAPHFGDAGFQAPEGGGTGCTNLQCHVNACGAVAPGDASADDGGGDGGDNPGTTITGTVYDPAGKNPIYNVVVYVPNTQGGTLDAIPIGIGTNSCSCDALFSGQPITTAQTDTAGNFTLKHVPDGANIPLVIQIGKWRKEITVPTVTACTSNSAGKITLPKNLTDGQFVSMPNIAVSTGSADTLECLLARAGVDEKVYTGDANGPGIHVFQGAGGHAASGSPKSPTSLWDSQADLMRYDIVMLSCEGEPTAGVTATTATYLAPYISAGGRVFAEHYHYAFFTSYPAVTSKSTTGTAYPQFANVANWDNVGYSASDGYVAAVGGVIQTTLASGAKFPEGQALKDWLGNVGALNASQELVIPAGDGRYNATVSSTNVGTAWVQTDTAASTQSTQYFSWDMPFNPPVDDAGVPQYCGRVVFSDLHVSGSGKDYTSGGGTVPAGCDATADLTDDEKAIEFILFDLSSCLVPIGFTPSSPQPEGGVAQ